MTILTSKPSSVKVSAETLLCGNSASMRSVRALVTQVAHRNASILITGPSGSGKERVAQAIHAESDRCDQPFVAINCGAIPRDLLESELFGHEKGSFTGAHATRVGRFEEADGGTHCEFWKSVLSSAWEAAHASQLMYGLFQQPTAI